MITSRRYYMNSIGYPSESTSSSKWHAWFASRCPDRRLSTWQTTAASCPTALGALCGQLTFRLTWHREHSAVTATELLQPRDLACGTQLHNLDFTYGLFRRQLKGHLFGKHEHGVLWLLICWRHRKTLTYLFVNVHQVELLR